MKWISFAAIMWHPGRHFTKQMGQKQTCYLVTWVQHIMFDGQYIVKAAPPGGGRAK